MARGIDAGLIDPPLNFPADRIDFLDRLDGVVEEFNAQRRAILIRGKHFDDVAAYPESAPIKIVVAALILDIDEFPQHLVTRYRCSFFKINHQIEVGLGGTQAINARDARHDQGVAPLQQRLGSGMAQLIDLVVDRRVLLNVSIRRRNVGLRLIVVVIAHEVANGIFRKQFPELAVELGGQGFIRRNDQGRPVGSSDDIGHGKSLAGAGHA